MTALSIRNVRRGSRKGFTLIEILIVVIILGILAAIVIPQFSSASTQARTSALQSTVQTLRSQIALYKLQHGDTLPVISGSNWAALTGTSTYNGTTYGPYLPAVPTNSLSNNFLVNNGTSAGGFQTGYDYLYDYNSGAGSGNIWGQTSNVAGGSVLP
jgi:general secretion pathway protein G